MACISKSTFIFSMAAPSYEYYTGRVHFRAAYLGLGTPVGLVLKFTAWVHSYRPCMHLEFHPNKFTVTDQQLIY